MTSTQPPPSGVASRLRWRWIASIAMLGVLLHVQALSVGLAGDDFIHLAMLEGTYPGERNPLELFLFFRDDPVELAAHTAFGTAPWWTVDEFYGGVLRPLASGLMWLEHRAFSLTAAPRHAHSMFWWAAAIVAAGSFLRRIFSPRVAALALCAFAFDDAAALPVAWLANRAVLVSAAFAFVALWSHVRWREEGWRPGPWIEAAAWALALSAGEYALSGAAFALAYELVIGRHFGAKRAALGLLPAGASVVAYLTLHRALGYGTVGSAVYVDPFVEPGSYAGWALHRIPRLWSELIFGIPSNVGEFSTRIGFEWAWWLDANPTMSERFRLVWILGSAACAVSVALYGWARRRLDLAPRRRVDWLALGALAGLLPVAAAPAHERLLLLPNLGASAIVACFILASIGGSWPASRRAASRAASVAVAAALAIPHLIIEPMAVVRKESEFGRAHAGVSRALNDPELVATDFRDKRVVLVTAAEPTTGIHGHLVLDAAGHAMPRSWHVLSMTPQPYVLKRTGARSLELGSIGGPMLLEPPERFFRPEGFELAVGESRIAGEMRATVLAARDGGPIRVRFDFDHSLDAREFVLLVAGREGLRPIEVPKLGTSVPIPIPRVPGTQFVATRRR